MEEESEGQIPFLDTLVRKEETEVKTSVYRKPTATDRYIHFDTHHQKKKLRGVLQCLRDRAQSLCSASTRGELAHLTKVFQANGYPKSLVHGTLYKPREKPTPNATTSEEEKPKLLYLPYVKGVSERIVQEAKSLQVRTHPKRKPNESEERKTG